MTLPYKSLVLDTESTGLFDFSKPADADGQPRLAHLGMIYLDGSLAVEREDSFLVKPDGWVMPAEAEKINGLSTDYLAHHGRPVVSALGAFTAAIDAGYVVVAFNAQYDLKMLRGELRRASIPDRFDITRNLCVMRACTGVCKIKKATGSGYKFPKLAEALAHFNFPQAGNHTAMDDARGAMLIYRKLVEIGCCPEPDVHKAREGTKAGDALKASGRKPEPRTDLPEPPLVPRRAPASDADIAASEIPE